MSPKSFLNISISLFTLLCLSSPALAEIMVKPGWLRTHLPNRPAAGYFELINHGGADTLLSAASPAYQTVEIHTHMMKDGVMRMRKLESLDVPAHGNLRFKPHGLHLMLFDPIKPLENGDEVDVTLRFETAGKVQLTLTVGDKPKTTNSGKTPHQPGHQNHHNHAGH
ncbi:MAG: copper chaperone PCu(A)C [Parvibaculales bacterium]